MYDTGGTQSVCDLRPADYNVGARVSWLAGELARQGARRGRTLWGARGRPEPPYPERLLPAAQAFARFGCLLGLVPPAAIFLRMFGEELARQQSRHGLLALLLVMYLFCGFVGRQFGAFLGRGADALRELSWGYMLVASAAVGLVWGVVTGGAGGAVFFGFGALFGAACAAAVAVPAFLIFMPLHRLLARGGMIEERHFWPLACGAAGVVTALILSPRIFAY